MHCGNVPSSCILSMYIVTLGLSSLSILTVLQPLRSEMLRLAQSLQSHASWLHVLNRLCPQDGDREINDKLVSQDDGKPVQVRLSPSLCCVGLVNVPDRHQWTSSRAERETFGQGSNLILAKTANTCLHGAWISVRLMA